MRIWLIGGTSESKKLAQELAVLNLPVVVTVVTPSASSLYPSSSSLEIWVGKLDESVIHDFLAHYNISLILDASHPYSVEISQLALGISHQLNLPYLRFERDSITPNLELNDSPWIKIIPDWETLFSAINWKGERVLLTVGYRALNLFKPYHNNAQLFARILPSVTALEAALEAGFTPEKLIAIRPPISEQLERAIWEKWGISTVITKASGTPGGEGIKCKLCQELGVKLMIIARPTMIYPQHTNNVEEALSFCQKNLS